MYLCPCFSIVPYKDCCEPFHKGVREAPTPTAMMRSRFAAYGAKDYGYLWRTMDASHEYRAASESNFIAAARDASMSRRYLGLTIYDQRPADTTGLAKVLFHARVFDRGSDVSFVECSDFVHDGKGWRYLMCTATPPRTDGFDRTIDKFLTLQLT